MGVHFQAYQAVIDWHTHFHSRIKTFVKNELKKRGSVDDVRAFVKAALKRATGLAFWAEYDPDVSEQNPVVIVAHVSIRMTV